MYNEIMEKGKWKENSCCCIVYFWKWWELYFVTRELNIKNLINSYKLEADISRFISQITFKQMWSKH